TDDRGVVPAHVPAERVRSEFDVNHSDHYRRDPFGFLVERLGEGPFWSPADGGYWVLTNAEQIRDCVRQPELFSSRYMMSGIPPSRHLPMLAIPGEQDPPYHSMYRNPMVPLFSQTAIAELEPAIRGLADDLLSQIVPKGSCELITEFAGPLPIHVFAQW